MVLDNSCHIGHAAVAELKGVPVEDFGIVVSMWKVTVYHSKKFSPYVCSYMAAIRRVVPNHFAVSCVPSSPFIFGLKLQICIISIVF